MQTPAVIFGVGLLLPLHLLKIRPQPRRGLLFIGVLAAFLCADDGSARWKVYRPDAGLDLWFYNGGEASLDDYLLLTEDEKRRVWDYMTALPMYQELEVGGRKFVLLHGGLGSFSPSRPLSDYEPNEFLWCRPEPDTVYYPDKYVVFGHTPVQLLDMDNGSLEASARIYRKGNLVDINCGRVFPGGRLGCLCLDTMEEIYV